MLTPKVEPKSKDGTPPSSSDESESSDSQVDADAVPPSPITAVQIPPALPPPQIPLPPPLPTTPVTATPVHLPPIAGPPPGNVPVSSDPTDFGLSNLSQSSWTESHHPGPSIPKKWQGPHPFPATGPQTFGDESPPTPLKKKTKKVTKKSKPNNQKTKPEPEHDPNFEYFIPIPANYRSARYDLETIGKLIIWNWPKARDRLRSYIRHLYGQFAWVGNARRPTKSAATSGFIAKMKDMIELLETLMGVLPVMPLPNMFPFFNFCFRNYLIEFAGGAWDRALDIPELSPSHTDRVAVPDRVPVRVRFPWRRTVIGLRWMELYRDILTKADQAVSKAHLGAMEQLTFETFGMLYKNIWFHVRWREENLRWEYYDISSRPMRDASRDLRMVRTNWKDWMFGMFTDYVKAQDDTCLLQIADFFKRTTKRWQHRHSMNRPPAQLAEVRVTMVREFLTEFYANYFGSHQRICDLRSWKSTTPPCDDTNGVIFRYPGIGVHWSEVQYESPNPTLWQPHT